MTTALFETEVGNINIEFFSDDAPNTVKNFTNLISDGFYDGLAFHRVCLLYTSPSPRDKRQSRMPSSA